MVKIIAHHLPQYHEFDENNMWWGRGFTEWTCVRNAEPSRHRIKKPHSDIGYYCLLDIDARKKQADLARSYGVFGFCYYHYWFGGKVLMEAPLELMLLDGQPDLPFCFSWANEAWTRRMHSGNGEVLQPTKHGGPDEWADHLSYLLQFFKHKNYILVDNKPMLLIYRVSDITNYRDRFLYWNDEIQRHGFDGIFIVMTNTNYREDVPAILPHVSASVDFFPNFLGKPDMISELDGNVAYYDMDRTFDRIIQSPTTHQRHFHGMLVGFDSLPRRGNRCNVFVNGSPEKFYRALVRQISRSKEDYVFINAWNEWGEGCALEPEELDGYAYLEAVKRAVTTKVMA